MTEFSDRVHEAFHQIAGKEAEEKGQAQFTLVTSDDDVRKSPLSDHFMVFDTAWSQKFYSIMRRQYRHQAGSEVPEGYPQMHEKLKTLLVEPLVPFYKQCLAAGIQMGQEEASAIKRAKRLGRVSELFKKDEFISECSLMAMTWDGDYELSEHLGRYLEGSAIQLANHTGLPHSSDPDHLGRGWDVWGVSGRSLMALCYSVGELIGAEDKEKDIIAHAQKEMDRGTES